MILALDVCNTKVRLAIVAIEKIEERSTLYKLY